MANNEAAKEKMSMDQKLSDYWDNLIRPLFEDAASFDVLPFAKGFKLELNWVFDTDDPVRSKKVSKPLHIIIPFETIFEYQGKSGSWQNSANGKIIQFIKKYLENFDPRNMEPTELIVPNQILY
jgi:hypothetical protein